MSLAAKVCEQQWEAALQEHLQAVALRDDLTDRIIPLLDVRRMEAYEAFRVASLAVRGKRERGA
jgi:hypothetical protein